MSPLWEARREEKTKKTHFGKRVFCCGLPILPSMASMWGHGRKQKRMPIGASMSPLWEERKEEKKENHILEKVVFVVVCPHTGLYGINVGAREEAKTKKPRFRKCGFFVVCP